MYLCDVCTIPTNLAGHPAIVGAVRHRRRAVCPIGVQVLAPALGEPTMFRVARAIEQAAAGRAQIVTASETRQYEPVIGLEVHFELATATKPVTPA